MQELLYRAPSLCPWDACSRYCRQLGGVNSGQHKAKMSSSATITGCVTICSPYTKSNGQSTDGVLPTAEAGLEDL